MSVQPAALCGIFGKCGEVGASNWKFFLILSLSLVSSQWPADQKASAERGENIVLAALFVKNYYRFRFYRCPQNSKLNRTRLESGFFLLDVMLGPTLPKINDDQGQTMLPSRLGRADQQASGPPFYER